MKLRLFGIERCDFCAALCEELADREVEFIYIDANADDTQELCDKHDVYDVPHIQILDDENEDEVMYTCRDFCDIDYILQIKEALELEKG